MPFPTTLSHARARISARLLALLVGGPLTELPTEGDVAEALDAALNEYGSLVFAHGDSESACAHCEAPDLHGPAEHRRRDA
jgi:hypothetical protein